MMRHLLDIFNCFGVMLPCKSKTENGYVLNKPEHHKRLPYPSPSMDQIAKNKPPHLRPISQSFSGVGPSAGCRFSDDSEYTRPVFTRLFGSHLTNEQDTCSQRNAPANERDIRKHGEVQYFHSMLYDPTGKTNPQVIVYTEYDHGGVWEVMSFNYAMIAEGFPEAVKKAGEDLNVLQKRQQRYG